MSRVRVEIKEAEGNAGWMFHIYGQNGEHQAMSEGYSRKADAKRGLDDLCQSLLIHYFREGKLDDMLRNAGISLRWIGDTEPEQKPEGAIDEFVGTRPPERPPRKPSSIDDLGI